MNHTSLHRISHTWLLAVIVVIGMAASLIQPAGAQVMLPNLLATQFFNAIGGDPSEILLDTDAVLHTPEGTFTGTDGLAQFGRELERSFSNVQFAMNSSAHASEGFVIASFTLTGINTGSYRGAEANCAGIAVQGVAFLELTEVTDIADWWPMHGNNMEPPMETETVVTEQWVSYDAGAIASQIAAYNALDSTYRPTCASQGFSLTGSEPATDPSVAPSCITARECALAY